ncbi:MAG TPA: ion channel [Kofleriaceae bacterium]|nr:ion channel [Kofleriaceae bacterium]
MAEQPAGYKVNILGAPPTPLRDAFHAFQRLRWRWAIAWIVVGWMSINLVFAVLYWLVGGVANASPHSFADDFYFSAHTLGTIGYGSMYPQTTAANLLVIAESVVGLLATAVATGLVFTKFSHAAGRVAFTREIVIAPVDGVPTLMVRLGNERGNQIVDTRFRMMYSRTEVTREGVTLYRMYDLRLVRERAPVLARSWTVMHRIEADSPLFGQTPADLKRQEAEIIIMVVGLDDTTGQTTHAVKRYLDPDIRWGARHADILTDTPDGNMELDLRKFHDTIATEPTESFPYPS